MRSMRGLPGGDGESNHGSMMESSMKESIGAGSVHRSEESEVMVCCGSRRLQRGTGSAIREEFAKLS